MLPQTGEYLHTRCHLAEAGPAVPIPDPGRKKNRIILEGDIPGTIDLPKGCPFAARCKMRKPECLEFRPETKEVEPGHFVSCHLFRFRRRK